MKDKSCFSWKHASKNASRYVLVVSTIVLIVLLTFPTLPIVSPSDADSQSPSSLEPVTTQRISYTATSTPSQEKPFTMIILNDPQFGWEDQTNLCYEQWHKVRTIKAIYDGTWFKNWPSRTELGSNLLFDREMQYSEVPHQPGDLKGVIINGDLSYTGNFNDDQGMDGLVATNDMKPRSEKRNWFYRDYYVTYLNEACPGLQVYAGLGNHDNKWNHYDLACALTLGKEYEEGGSEWKWYDATKRRLWKNFPTTGISYDFKQVGDHWEGSLAYSWDIENYHFVQANLIIGKHTLNLGDKWLDDMYSGYALAWVKSDIQNATDADKKIVLCFHGNDACWDKLENDTTNKLNYDNVVAVFKGHTYSNTGFVEMLNGKYGAGGAYVRNSFGNTIPIFQAGHSAKADHKLLIVECADDYMNVGVVDCGDWGDNRLLPKVGYYNCKDGDYMQTLKWVDTAPFANVEPVSSPISEGQEVSVTGYFTDGDIVTAPPAIFDNWDSSTVDYGDNTTDKLTSTDQRNGTHTFDMRHIYRDDDKYTIKVNVTDSQGKFDVSSVDVTVLNTDPIVDVSNKTVFKGENFTLTASFSDPGVLDKHYATVEWGDGTSDPGTVDEQDGSGTVTASHIYNAPGCYTANVTVNDYDGGSNHKIAHINVIVALSGFVTNEYDNNRPIADVTITCDGETTTTKASGYYEITPLIPGDYSVNITKPGYASIVPSKGASITAGQETQVNFTAYPLPDIIVTKATVDTERLAGNTITYQITVENQGEGPATNMVVSDVIPNMTTFVSSTPPYANVQGQNVWLLIGGLANQSSTTIELTVRTSLLLYPDTILNNSVTVDFDDWKELPQTSETASATTTILSTVPTENLQGIGYWRHQVKAFLDGKSCDYTESEWYLLFDKIRASSQIYDFDYTLENVSDIILAKATGKDTMETQARQQLFALWLNLAARAVAADTAVELADLTTVTTVAEVLTHCEDMLLDPDRTKTTCECSKDICDCINNCEGLPW